MDFYFLNTDSPDLHSAAIMEAKKWLQEKKSGLDTTSVIGYGSPSLNLFALPQVSDSVCGETILIFVHAISFPFSLHIMYIMVT